MNAHSDSAAENQFLMLPTMLINNRMIIGTLPYEHMRAGRKKFIENWVAPVKKKKR